MGALIAQVIAFFTSSAIARMLAGAGMGIITSTVVLDLLNQYVNNAVTQINSGTSSLMASSMCFLGLSGSDVAISIILGALIAKATLSTFKSSIGFVSNNSGGGT